MALYLVRAKPKKELAGLRKETGLWQNIKA